VAYGIKPGIAEKRRNFNEEFFQKFQSLISRLLSIEKKKQFEEVGYPIILKQLEYF
jgi:hypothetical protein